LTVTSDNNEILIIQHLSRVIREWKFLHFYLKTASLLKQPDLWDMLIKPQVCLYINSCGISWPLVSHSINFFSYEDSRKHRSGPWWLWTSGL